MHLKTGFNIKLHLHKSNPLKVQLIIEKISIFKSVVEMDSALKFKKFRKPVLSISLDGRAVHDLHRRSSGRLLLCCSKERSLCI